MSKGWICLHRCIQKHWIWQDANRFKWWVDLLLRANHEGKKVFIDGSLAECKRGQLITSLSKLAEEWGVSRDVVRHFLAILESDTMITRNTTQKHTQITICNYDSYQDVPTTEPQLSHNRPTTEPQLSHTNNNYNNVNNKENNNNIGGYKNSRFMPPSVDDVRAYCQERGNDVDAERFVSYYTSNGWKVGKNRMKDWKAAVRTWEKSSEEKQQGRPSNLGIGEYMDGDRRTYGSGSFTIPKEAPPRPSSSHAWNPSTGQWIVY